MASLAAACAYWPRGVVAGSDGVVGEDRRVAESDALEGIEHPGMQPRSRRRRDRALHGLPSQLVRNTRPPRCASRSRGLDSPERRQIDTERRQHPIIETVRCGCHELQHLEVFVLTSAVRARTASRTERAGALRILGDLGDEEGLPPVSAWTRSGSSARAVDQLLAHRQRQRLKLERA